MPQLTPFQTVGPFLHLGLRDGLGPMIASGLTTPIVIRGKLLDGGGTGMPDGVLEFWAAGFDGIGRACTDSEGGYRLETRMPASRHEANGTVAAPHFAIRVLARGVLTEYLTRVYFEGDPANESDAVLRAVPADRRATLVARAITTTEHHFDIVVQGERETVFFDL